MLKKLSPPEFKKFIVEATGRPGQTYISRNTLKALKAKGLSSHLTSCSALPGQIRKAIKTLKEEGLLSGCRGYIKKSPESIFRSYQKKYGLTKKTKNVVRKENKTMEQGRSEKKMDLKAEKLWQKRIQIHQEYIRRERTKEEQENRKRGEYLESEIPSAKKAEDLPLAA